MKRLTGMTAASLLVLGSGVAVAALDNGDFAEYDRTADGTTIGYAQNEGPPMWFLTAGSGSLSFVETDAFERGAYFEFDELGEGFGANKLEQCVPVSDAEAISISYAVYAATPTDNADGLGVRINPNFYATVEDCLFAQADDSGGERLSGGRSNDDADFILGEDDGRQWIERTPAQQPALMYAAEDIPEGSRYMNLSVRARDRSGIAPAPPLRFDRIAVTQGGSSANLVVNGHFDHAEVFDGGPLAGSVGWVVSRDGDALARAAVGEASFALAGSNVLTMEDLTGNFGASRLDQCVALDGQDIRPSAFAYTLRPDAALQVRLNVDFYPQADCGGDADNALRIREDFPLEGDAGTWQALVTEEVRSAGEYADAPSALVSVRLRDRSGDGDGPGEYARIVHLDEISAVAAVAAPSFSPAPGEYTDSVTVALTTASSDAVIYYTLDGSAPDTGSATLGNGEELTISESATLSAVAFLDGELSAVRAGDYSIVAAPAEPAPSGPLNRSTGCSVSAQPGPLDPSLWLMACLALGMLAWRRRRRAD